MINRDDAIKAMTESVWPRLPSAGTPFEDMTEEHRQALADFIGVISGDRETVFRLIGLDPR